ncbi:MAG: SMP-30/gluconolactonase/LRE family protein [Balneolaceae bacterium]|nr:MAG: SMP-30/gluconolactonase/LRE family protein [Balneolaceae bacterium]
MKVTVNLSLLNVNIFLLLIAVLLMNTGCNDRPDETAATGTEIQTKGFVDVLDDELENILNIHAEPEILGKGFQWTEGPVWVEEHSFLLFSEIPANTIHRWSESDGITPYLNPAGYTGDSGRGGELGSNGLIIGINGELLLCQHGDRRIARMEAPLHQPAAEFTTIAGTYLGSRFNSPNDLVQHSSGSIYFTDPPYGLEGYVDDPERELDFQGVYRVDTDGTVTLLTDELSRPNGLAFSPDESLLYVANSDPGRAIWMVYDVLEDGGIANGRLFYDATEHVGAEPGLPDGMKVKNDGYVFATGPGGVWIISPDAKPLGIIKTGEFISNVAFDAEESTLFMTANSYLLRLKL